MNSAARRYGRQQVDPRPAAHHDVRILRDEIDRIAEQRDLLLDATRSFLGTYRDSLMTPTLREGITELSDTLVYVDDLERAHRVGA